MAIARPSRGSGYVGHPYEPGRAPAARYSQKMFPRSVSRSRRIALWTSAIVA